MTEDRKLADGLKLNREFKIERADGIDEDSRTVELAFSSEAPVERFFGVETLSHEAGAANLSRFNDGAAVLIDHSNSIRDQVAVVESARIDDDKVGRASVRFDTHPDADRVFQSVRNGIVQKVSIGYQIHKFEVTEGEANGPDEVRVTDWEPLEISFVAVPADASVGVGRAADSTTSTEGLPMVKKTSTEPGDDTRAQNDTAPDPTGDDAGRKQDAIAEPAKAPAGTVTIAAPDEDRTEVDARIRELGTKFDRSVLADRFVELRSSVEDFEAALRTSIVQPAPVPATRDILVSGGGPIHGSLRLARVLPHISAAELERNLYTGGMWIRGKLFGDAQALRWCRDHIGHRAMGEGVHTAGGALVPDAFSNLLIDLRDTFGLARRMCRIWPMTSDTLSIPRRTGSVTASWVGENATATAADAAFDSVMLVARKLMSLTQVSTELMEDSAVNIADFLGFDIGQKFAEAEDDAWLNGDGTSTYGGIVGVRPKLVDGNHAAGASDATAGDNTIPEIIAGDLDTVRSLVPEYASPNAVWACSKLAKSLVFDAITRAAGGNTMESLGGKPAPAYLGDEIVTSPKMPASATTDYENVAMLLYGDFMKACSLGTRREIRVRILGELYAAADQIGVQATERVDIVTHDLGDGTTAGPVVGLIGN